MPCESIYDKKNHNPTKSSFTWESMFLIRLGWSQSIKHKKGLSRERERFYCLYRTDEKSLKTPWLITLFLCMLWIRSRRSIQEPGKGSQTSSFSPCMRFTAGCTPCFPRGVLFIKTNGTTAWRGSPVQRGPCGPISEEDVMNANLLDVLVWILIASHKPNTHFLGEQI